jgi:hypothetical protein
MDRNDAGAEEKERIEQRASRDAMRLLTGGLTHEGDAFLIASGAVLLTIVLFPLIGAWALLAFPTVFGVAVLSRSARR